MLRRIGRNVRSLFWALVLGLSVWVAAVTAADPDELRTFPAPVSLEPVAQNPQLVVIGDLPRDVRVTLRAPQSVWNQLSVRPDSLRAVLDLSGIGAGEHRLEVKVLVDARPVRIVAVYPSVVDVTLEPLVNRAIQLESTLTGQPAVGYEAGALMLQPQKVIVAGPQSLVASVSQLRVVVNVSDKREGIDQDSPIVALDQQGAPVEGIRILPEVAHVTLPIIRQGGFRDVAVKVVLHGEVAAGYRLDSISVFPPVVTLYSANPELVNGLPGVIETQPLDLNAGSSNLSLRVSLDVPTGISIVGQQDVLIQAGISPIQSSVTLSGQQVEVSGLPANLQAQVSPAVVDVILSGPIPVLDTLTRQDVHVVLDASKLEPGSYQLAPSVQILASSLTVESLLPGTVELVIVPKVTPTVKP